MEDSKKKDNNTDLTKDSYTQQMQQTIANQQAQLNALSKQIYNTRTTNENATIIPTNTYANTVIDGGISGKDYYSSTPLSFVAPNQASRDRLAAANLMEYKTNEAFLDNFDTFISGIKNIPGVNDEVYNNLINNAYKSVDELSKREDLENISRHVKDLAKNITGQWGGTALNQSYNDYMTKVQDIRDKGDSFDPTKDGGYDPETQKYANYLLKNFKGVSINPDTGKPEYKGFNMPNIMEYKATPTYLDNMLKDWKANGTIITNPDGTFKLIKDIPGSAGIINRESITEAELRNAGLKYLDATGLSPYLEQQSTVRATNVLNDLAGIQANGGNVEQYLSNLVNTLQTNYTATRDSVDKDGKPIRISLDNTQAVLYQLQKNKGNRSYQDMLLGNGAMGLKLLLRSKIEDDLVGTPSAKFSYNKDTYHNYSDEQVKADIEFANKQRLNDAGLLFAPKSGKSGSSGDGSDDGLGFESGPETFAISVINDGPTNTGNYTISKLSKYKKEFTKNYKDSYNNLVLLRRQAKQGDKSIAPENIIKAEDSLKQADKELRYVTDSYNTISNTAQKLLTDNGFNYDNWYNTLTVGNPDLKMSKDDFKNLVSELTGTILEDDRSAITDFLIRNGNAIDIFKKYGLEYNKYSQVQNNNLDRLYSSINKKVNKLNKEDKYRILNPHVDAKYLLFDGANAKNVDKKSYAAYINLVKKQFEDSPNNFKALDKNGNPVSFLEAMAVETGLDLEDVYSVIDMSKTELNPLINREPIVNKKIKGGGVQYLANIGININSDVYKKNKGKFEDIMKNGKYKIILQSNELNAINSNRELNKHTIELFKDMASRGGSSANSEVIRALGTLNAYSSGLYDDFNKQSYYDLDPDTSQGIKTKKVNLAGDEVEIGAIYSDAINKGVTDKDFFIMRKDPNNKNVKQFLVKDKTTGITTWADSESININDGFGRNGRYERVIGNTPDDLLAVYSTAKLYEQLYKERLAKSNNSKYANGGNLRGASTYNMSPEFRRSAYMIRQVESSNDYTKTPDKDGIGYGAYQVVPSQHADNIKRLYNVNIDEFTKNPTLQDSYYEHLAKGYKTYLSNGNRGSRLLNIIRKFNPSATSDDMYAAIHFWGTGNIDNLLKGKYTIYDKIPFIDKKGIKRYNPSLIEHLTKIKNTY